MKKPNAIEVVLVSEEEASGTPPSPPVAVVAEPEQPS